jgi:hypothetical protein
MFIRALMCLTAGATRFPYWKFFLADFAGACLSVPFFVVLGYWFAHMVPTLLANMKSVQIYALVGIGVLVLGAIVWFKVWALRRRSVADEDFEPMEEAIAEMREHTQLHPTEPGEPAEPDAERKPAREKAGVLADEPGTG